MANLPYVTATGNIGRALNAIATAATPDAVSGNFVKTILKVPGGSGDQMTSFLKKIGFAATDGKPTEIYRRFRNPATRGAAAAASLRFGYAPLYKRNEFLHELNDKDLKGLIVEETGAASDANVPAMVLASIKAIRGFATFDETENELHDTGPTTAPQLPSASELIPSHPSHQGTVGLSVGYNIHLNLPATTDISVFNAIFKSLKENLLPPGDG
ncbi:DUF5343 domain-containing protein [Sphingomonas sp. SUN039]|uniref:DUF5343 domain-containing protein n=1 Tax=Sphingomonas sp. SUN039 TaxID=2937787 RepID=UPI002164A295|nr:DUF5343 domain-containing protein [Sphingomonas sp. SUN039]UVO55438.1 DUF5343 domain-containing protein [Sphingomonas sp. SUN039]